MKVRSSLTCVAVVALLLGAGCGGDDAQPTGATSSSPPSDPGPAALAGTEWVVDGLALDGADYPLAAASLPTIAFASGRPDVSGTTGCNSYFGTVRFGADQEVHIGELGMTEMACVDPPGLMDQEAAFVAALPTVRFYTVMEDRLTMVSQDGRVTITAVARTTFDPDVSLGGVVWLADTRIDGDAASTMLPEVPVSLTFDPDAGAVEGDAGCNAFSTDYTHDGAGILVFGPVLASSAQLCADDVMEQELFVLGVFAGTAIYEIDGGRLTILNDRGLGLGFTAAE